VLKVKFQAVRFLRGSREFLRLHPIERYLSRQLCDIDIPVKSKFMISRIKDTSMSSFDEIDIDSMSIFEKSIWEN
jgi:hypothetical protein